MTSVVYLKRLKPFGSTDKANHAIIRRFDLYRISKSFNGLTSRHIITNEIIHNQFKETVQGKFDPVVIRQLQWVSIETVVDDAVL